MSEEMNRKSEPIIETTAGAINEAAGGAAAEPINEAVNIAADEATSEPKPVTKGNEPEKDGLFKLGCLLIVGVYIGCVIMIFRTFFGSVFDSMGLNKWAENKQKAREEEEQAQEAVIQWFKTYMPDAELIGTPVEYSFKDDNKVLKCKALSGTMRHNGRGFSYVYEPKFNQMYSNEYGDTFDKEFDQWLHGQLFFATEGEEKLHYTVTEKLYQTLIIDHYECKMLKFTRYGPLYADSMHPATMKEEMIGGWISGNYSKHYKVTENLTLIGCKDLSDIAVVKDLEEGTNGSEDATENESDATTKIVTKGINARICASLCDESEIKLFNEDKTSYMRLTTHGSEVTVSYWMVDRSREPDPSGWYRYKTETYQIE